MKAGRNAACPCGSGRKSKHCCGAPARTSVDAPGVDAAGLYARAVERLRRGDTAQAERLCSAVLATQPRHVDAINLSAVIVARRFEYGRAEELFKAALALAPADGQVHMNLGCLYREQRRFDLAQPLLERAVQLQPRSEEALFNLALVLSDRGVQVSDNAALAVLLALDASVDFALAMAVELAQSKKLEEAAACAQRAVDRDPGHCAALCELGALLAGLDRLDQAQAALERALSLNPRSPEVHIGRGNLCLQRERFEDAMVCYERALALDPRSAEALCHRARARYFQRDLAAAERDLRAACAAAPQLAAAHYVLGEVLLQQGRFEEGWREYEWRWHDGPAAPVKARLPQPQWEGQPLHGRTVLLHGEQGLGDTIQFVRYAPLVAQRGARVLIYCEPALKPLLEGTEGVVGVLTEADPLPPFDYYCPMLSLPRVFGTEAQTVPHAVPYLRASPAAIAHWAARLGEAAHPRMGLARVGLAWAGNPEYAADRRRSIAWRELVPLLSVPGVRFVSLQRPIPGHFALEGYVPGEIADCMHDVPDLAATAALMHNLDLIVSVDTAVAHLALGRPVWLLSRFDGDWRWMLGRSDSPWYPTLRIFRQERPGEWAATLQQVAEALRAWATSAGADLR